MFYNNLEFHNVTELERNEHLPGLILRRLPSEVRNKLGVKEHEKGRVVSQTSTGCEIRFVTSSKYIRIYLSSLGGDGEVLVFKGNFFHSKHILKDGIITTLNLEEPERFNEIKPDKLKGYSFSSNVWRICMGRGFIAVFYGIDTFGQKLRAPYENEVPKIKWLAYGSSITHGSVSLSYTTSYIQQAARRLGIDVLCCGLSGACMCEKELADYLSSRNDWDFATLELGVNMRGQLNSDEFETQTRYFIKKITEENPNKPIIVINIFPNRAEYFIDEKNIFHVRNIEFNKILKSIYDKLNLDNLYLIDGKDILTDFSSLSSDLIHPSDYGHILMGQNLADKLKNILNKYF